MGKNVCPLLSLSENDEAIISRINDCSLGKERLMAFGIAKGSRVAMFHHGKAGGPCAISVMGSVVALRGEDLRRIEVERWEKTTGEGGRNHG